MSDSRSIVINCLIFVVYFVAVLLLTFEWLEAVTVVKIRLNENSACIVVHRLVPANTLKGICNITLLIIVCCFPPPPLHMVLLSFSGFYSDIHSCTIAIEL